MTRLYSSCDFISMRNLCFCGLNICLYFYSYIQGQYYWRKCKFSEQLKSSLLEILKHWTWTWSEGHFFFCETTCSKLSRAGRGLKMHPRITFSFYFRGCRIVTNSSLKMSNELHFEPRWMPLIELKALRNEYLWGWRSCYLGWSDIVGEIWICSFWIWSN